MDILPQSAHTILRQLPLVTGILWAQSEIGLPIFLLANATFTSYEPDHSPIKIHMYQPKGVLLEFQLTSGTGVCISLLINPSDVRQWGLLKNLAETSCIEIWECNQQASQCLSKKFIRWPEEYRQALRKIQKQSFPITQWPAILERWKQDFQNAQMPQQSVVAIPPNGLGFSSQPQPIVDDHTHIFQKMKNAGPFTLFWRPGKNGIPECLVKHKNASYSRFDVAYSNISVKSDSQKEDILVLPFTIISGSKKSLVNIPRKSLFNLSNAVDKKVLSQLSTAKDILFFCYDAGRLDQPPLQKWRKGLPKSLRRNIASQLKLYSSDNRTITSSPNLTNLPSQKREDSSSKLGDKTSTSVTQSMQAKHNGQPENGTHSDLSPSTLFERCLVRQKHLIASIYTPDQPLARSVFWRMHMLPALELAEQFTIDVAALSLIEENRSSFSKRSNAQLQSTDKLVRPHLWFALQQPLVTPICQDVAAILVSTLKDDKIYQYMQKEWRNDSKVLSEMKKPTSVPERRYQVLWAFNFKGELVWSMNFSSSISLQSTHWLQPLWRACPSHKCQTTYQSGSSVYVPCSQCKQALIFFSSWFQTVRFALEGVYQERRSIDRSLLSHGSMKDGKDEVLSRDKIVRYIDLSEHLRRYYGSDPVNSRGSWVEAHLKADPTSVAYETHEVAEHVRILNPQHHQRYIETHGTNEVIVHSHKRRTPKLAHVEHITKMTARRFRHKP